jgi:DNA-directed RNA polymerase subunit H (RpoH/RPB5)
MSHTNSTLVSKIYTSRNVLLEQLKERGFDVSNYDNFSVNEMHIMLQNKQCDMLVENDEGHKVYVKYHIQKALRPNTIYETIDDLFNIEMTLNKETDSIIFITRQDANDTLTKCMRQIFDHEKILVRIYNIARLQFNILNHNLVPKHVVLSEEEKAKVIEKYHINADSELPEISRFDPVAIAIGIRPGQLCEITRNSLTAIEGKYYRLCI